MPARGAADTADVGITGLNLAEGTQRPVVGAEVTFEAELVNNSQAAEVRDVTFTVDGKAAAEGPGGVANLALNPRVQLGGAGGRGEGGGGAARTTVRIAYRLAEPGLRRFGIQLANAPDALKWDDAREMLLEVADKIRVLVVGAEAPDAQGNPRARSAAFYFQAALAPFAGSNVPWSIEPVYRGIDQVQTAAALQGYAAVFLCDVPRISPALADALVSYGRNGGRIVWVLGPSINQAAYNETLLTSGRELLPAPLGLPEVRPAAQALDWVDLRSGIFMNLFDSQDPFRNALITGRWTLNGEARGVGGRALAKLADNSSLVVQHGVAGSTGTGRIYTVLTTPAAVWSNLGGTVLLVPMAARMALGDFEEARGLDTSYATGQSITLRLPEGAAGGAAAVDVTTPAGSVINVKAANGQGVFDRTQMPGQYGWKTVDGKAEGRFVVNVPGEEADLLEADVSALAKESSPGVTEPGQPTLIAGSAADLLAQLQSKSEGTSLAPGFIAMVLMLAVVEALMANRTR
jgi:hypothetical protein